ncbi:hypothetical protein F157LOC_01467 [Pectobacterium brasiliense]|nr:hypothetical protein F157LOC_01467 [Pectobacterium brasiliense]GKW31028.1 hypothetical protein PEC331060_42060 [Pectobacterium carotovorum subsp. carotovorum]
MAEGQRNGLYTGNRFKGGCSLEPILDATGPFSITCLCFAKQCLFGGIEKVVRQSIASCCACQRQRAG